MEARVEKPHLSPTALGLLSRCGLAYAYRYLDGIRKPPRAAMIRGTGTHKGTEATLRHKIETGELLTDEAVAQAAADGFEGAWAAESVELSDEERSIGLAVVKGTAKDDSIALAKLYNRLVAPAVKPKHVERKLSLEIADFPFDLLGYADVVEESGTIRDGKTSGKPPREDAIIDSIQAEVYPAAVEIIDGVRPAEFKLDYLVVQKTQLQAVTLTRPTPADNALLFRRMEAAAKVIESGAYMPADPTWWGCSQNWCGYWFECPFGARHRSVHVAVEARKEKR